MSENKLDRANLRRQAQRVESYKSLISRRRSTLKNNSSLKKLNCFDTALKLDSNHCFPRELEDEQPNKDNHVSSPSSSTTGGSSDTSQDFHPNLCPSLKAIQSTPYQSEREVSSVMTRSATRKYVSVGAIHNPVDIDEELRTIKRWPTNIAYPIPNRPDDYTLLREAVTRSFCEVLTFCKTAIAFEYKEPQTEPVDSDLWAVPETEESFIDLAPYLTKEPNSANGSDDNRITFHLNEDFITQPFVNIIAINEEDQSGTLVIDEEGEDEYETITLHAGDTYVVDKYFSDSSSPPFDSDDTQAFTPQSPMPSDPILAITNDHTYAAKPNENLIIRDPETPRKTPSPTNEENEFKLENALNDLLLNTAILKCLICNETPQEIMSQLDMARTYLYNEK